MATSSDRPDGSIPWMAHVVCYDAMSMPLSSQSETPTRRIRKPIIVMGCARSATTMLGRILSQHPDVAMWHELRMIWMYGHAYQGHDELDAADLTPRIARHIDRKFANYLQQSGRTRFGEKTPSNCFRIPFIHALYPDCRIINIIRDGRHVVRSILQVQAGGASRSTVASRTSRRRFRKRIAHTPLWEWPAYLPRFFRTFWRAQVMGKPMRYWGPMPKGWRELRELPRHLMIAEQWRASVGASVSAGRALPKKNYHEIRYESLMQQPLQVLRKMIEFAELQAAPEMLDYAASHIDPNRTHRWKGTLSDEQEREIEDRMRPMLLKLGYMNDSSDEAFLKDGSTEHVNR